MIFETSRLILRPWKIEDAEELYKYAKDPRVGPRAGWPVHTSVENSREIIETVFSTEGTFAVVLKETELPIGCIGIMRNANLSTPEDEVELGYWLGQPYWGQGLIPEACEELIKYCFETLNCSKIWCAYYRGNRNSCRVIQKCGFEFHHTEYDKYIDLLDEYRTEHVAVLTKERFDKIQQEGLENIISDGEWSVNFEGNFWGGFGWGSKNVPIHQSFQYCGYTCVVPYIYLCPEGVVIDYCTSVDPETVLEFLKKWNLNERMHYDDFTLEEIEAIQEEHPLNSSFEADWIKINGILLSRAHGSSMSYMPECCSQFVDKEQETEQLYIQRYGLDDKKAWNIRRLSYPWETEKSSSIESLVLHITSDEKSFEGIHIVNPKKGDRFNFKHPLTECEHSLTVLDYEKQIMDGKHFQDDDFEHPKHFVAMQYKIDPDIPMKKVSISDCSQGDSPRIKKNSDIIGGAVGVAVLVKTDKDPGYRTVCSSMHFEPLNHIEWRMTFREKISEDVEIKLL